MFYIGHKLEGLQLPKEEDYPEGCIVDYDFRLIDIFKKMAEDQKGLFEKIKDEYFRIQEVINERPLRLALYTYIDENINKSMITNNNLNIFRDYLGFLNKIDSVIEDESELVGNL